MALASFALCHAEDEKITLEQAPANIQKAIKHLAGSNKIIRIEKAHDDGKIEYEALTEKSNGKKIEFIIKADGTLDSTEERLDKNELSSDVAKTVESAVAGGKIHAIERITKEGVVTYEVAYKTAKGDKQEAVISSQGKLLKNGADND